MKDGTKKNTKKSIRCVEVDSRDFSSEHSGLSSELLMAQEEMSPHITILASLLVWAKSSAHRACHVELMQLLADFVAQHKANETNQINRNKRARQSDAPTIRMVARGLRKQWPSVTMVVYASVCVDVARVYA